MKKCFTFNNYKDCKTVVNHLRAIIPSPIHIQIGNSVMVYENAYETAVKEGKKYAIENQIICNWVDACDRELPIKFVPFAYIAASENHYILPHCISSSILSSVTNYADFCQCLLDRKVFIQIQLNGNIVFLIEDATSANEHIEMIKNVKEHSSYLKDNIFTELVFTDCFGNSI